ncbi:hypothetical protein, partial [Nostoc sp. NMS2]|uniref:hypothetical protein n=1 Tax=Nostoc sp. NMS2 TaxID=2815389 RepID=UPI0025E98A48
MSLIHPSSLGVILTPMKNFESKENREWGMGSGEWGAGEQGSRGAGEQGEQGSILRLRSVTGGAGE